MLFGNRMACCSLHTTTALASWALLPAHSGRATGATDATDRSAPRRVGRLARRVAAVLAASLAARAGLQRALQVRDDAHVWNLVRAKLGGFRDFHTSLYLNIDGYRPLPLHVYAELAQTGLLPAAGIAAGAIGAPPYSRRRRAPHRGGAGAHTA